MNSVSKVPASHTGKALAAIINIALTAAAMLAGGEALSQEVAPVPPVPARGPPWALPGEAPWRVA